MSVINANFDRISMILFVFFNPLSKLEQDAKIKSASHSNEKDISFLEKNNFSQKPLKCINIRNTSFYYQMNIISSHTLFSQVQSFGRIDKGSKITFSINLI